LGGGIESMDSLNDAAPLNFSDALATSKIDFTRIKVDIDTYDYFADGYPPFDLTPKDYLNFAKQDFKVDDTKGLINALTHAKRAIDCQLDSTIWQLKLDVENENLRDFCARFAVEERGLHFKLQLIGAFSLAPVFTIAGIRSLRNDIEHEYNKPKKKDVLGAIELAELFISSVDSKLGNLFRFELTDGKRKSGTKEGSFSGVIFGLHENMIRISLDNQDFSIGNDSPIYPASLAMMLSVINQDDVFESYLRYFVKLNGLKVPEEKIAVEYYD
jgi:hypothetical protein